MMFMVAGALQEVSFCSKECQLANWPRHKQQCGKPAGSAEGLEEPAGAPGNHSDDAGKRSVEVSLVDGSGMFEFAIPFNQTVKENVRRSKGLDDGIRDSTKAPPDIHGDKRWAPLPAALMAPATLRPAWLVAMWLSVMPLILQRLFCLAAQMH